MIKVFNPSDTVFTSGGNKTLKPISCIEKKVTNEDWTIETELPMSYIDFVQQDSIVIVPTKYGSQPFRVSNLSAKRSIEFTAYHVGFDSKLYIIDYLVTTGLTAQNCLNAVIAATTDTNHFTAYSDITTTKTLTFAQCTLYDALLAIQEAYGGFIDFNVWQIRLTSTLGADRGVVIQPGKNLEEAEVHEDWKEVCTTILGYGNGDITLTPKTRSSVIVYDRPYTKVKKYNTSDLAELESLVLADLDKYAVPNVNYKVKSTLQGVFLNDEILVKARQYTLMANVLSYTYNTLTGRNESVEFGNYIRTVRRAFSAINESIEEVKNRTNELRTITAIQTELLNNAGTYGYCARTANETYFFDTIPLSTATLIMRLNVAGLGFSSTGVAGPYTQAWTLDGHLNADFISGLTITGVKIETTEDMKVGKILSMVKVTPTTTTELVQMRRGLYGIHFGPTDKTYDGMPSPLYPWAYMSAIDRAFLAGLPDPLIEIIIGCNGALRLQTAGLDFAGSEPSTSLTALDAYEEGGFTPEVYGATTAGVAIYTVQTGKFQKVGNRVSFNLALSWTGHTGVGGLRFKGLPFFVRNVVPIFFVKVSSITIDSGTLFLQSYADIGSTTFEVLKYNGTSDSYIPMDTSGSIYVSGTYETD